MTPAVIDASVVVKLFLPEPDSSRAEQLLRQLRNEHRLAVAPDWCQSEVANALLQVALRGGIDPAEVSDLLREIPRFVRLEQVSNELVVRAFDLATRLGVRTIYDLQYLALAEALDSEYWTADERFWKLVRASFPFIRWLGEFT